MYVRHTVHRIWTHTQRHTQAHIHTCMQIHESTHIHTKAHKHTQKHTHKVLHTWMGAFILHHCKGDTETPLLTLQHPGNAIAPSNCPGPVAGSLDHGRSTQQDSRDKGRAHECACQNLAPSVFTQSHLNALSFPNLYQPP